jgi:NADPH:quinone reductase
MRALVMSEPAPGPERTAVQDVPDPRPGNGQVTIEVAHAGVNFLDVMALRGDPGYAPSWPYTLGLEVAGRVRETGPGVTGVAPGQRVAAFTRGGGFADVAVAEAASVVPIPDPVPTEIAAAPLMLSSSALLLLAGVTRTREGDAVLMHSAAGGVGCAVAQLVPVLGGGLRIGTVGRPEKVSEAIAAGWDVVLTRAESTPEKVHAAAGRGIRRRARPAGPQHELGKHLDVLQEVIVAMQPVVRR